MGTSVERILTICLNGSFPLNKMAAMPIYGKSTLKSTSPDQDSFEAVSKYIASGLKVYQICSNDGCGMTFDLLCQGQICASYI